MAYEVFNGASWLLGTAATSIGSALADAGLAGPVADDLGDDELLKLLGQASKAVYDFDDKRPGIKLTGDKGEMSAFYGADGCGATQWGIYEITTGRHAGKRILAFRGTLLNFQQLMQDLSMIINGPHIGHAVSEATGIAEDYSPDYLTGHSLGGFLAECVCSHLAIPGASFAAPGPIGQVTSNTLTGNKFGGVRWKTVINRMDCIATSIGGIGGSQSSHIVKSDRIRWLDFGGAPWTRHLMEEYINRL